MDGFIWNRNSRVRISLAFQRDHIHLELMLENCARGNCLAESTRRAEEAPNHFSSGFVHFPFGSIWNHPTRFHKYGYNWEIIRKQTHLEAISNSKWNCSKQSLGNARPIHVRKFHCSNWNWSLGNATLILTHLS